MALKVRNRSTEANGDRYKGGYYIAEAITAGIPKGTLVYVDGAGVVQIADHKTAKPAMGIIYSDDLKNINDEIVDNPEGNAMPRTKGGKSIEMEKKCIVDIISPNTKKYFRMKDETLTGTVAVAGAVALTGTGTAFLTELKVGDYIVVAGETIRQVDAITTDTAATVSVAFATTDTGLAITGKSMKNMPVFLGEAGTSTAFGKLNATIENLTTLQSVSTQAYQEVGFIDDTKIIHIDLTKQLLMATKA